MSAFQVSKGHIDRLVALALYGPSDAGGYRWNRLTWWTEDPRTAVRECTDYEDYRRRLNAIRREVTLENRDVVGEMLTRANLHSINARYPDTVDNPADIPGDATSAFVPYRFPARMRGASALRPLLPEALRAISCYEYQSCEADDWPDSEAHNFCDSLRNALCDVISREATRGWDDWDLVPAMPGGGPLMPVGSVQGARSAATGLSRSRRFRSFRWPLHRLYLGIPTARGAKARAAAFYWADGEGGVDVPAWPRYSIAEMAAVVVPAATRTASGGCVLVAPRSIHRHGKQRIEGGLKLNTATAALGPIRLAAGGIVEVARPGNELHTPSSRRSPATACPGQRSFFALHRLRCGGLHPG